MSDFTINHPLCYSYLYSAVSHAVGGLVVLPDCSKQTAQGLSMKFPYKLL